MTSQSVFTAKLASQIRDRELDFSTGPYLARLGSWFYIISFTLSATEFICDVSLSCGAPATAEACSFTPLHRLRPHHRAHL